MIVRTGESQPVTAESGTYSGILINVVMQAAAVNVAIAEADFKPQYITVKATKHEKNQVSVFNDNLLILGNYCAFYRGRFEFVSGFDKKLPAAGVAAVKVRTIFLDFKIPVHVAHGEKFVVEITVAGEGTFTAALNGGLSYLDFVLQPCIGYDWGTPSTIARVVQQNTTNESITLGNDICRVMMLNLDQADLTNEVLSSLTLSSDKLTYTRTFNQLLAQRVQAWPGTTQPRYGTALPPTGVFRGLDASPQSFNIYDGVGKGHDLDSCRLDASFNGANVNASQNYLVYTKYYPDAAKISAAQQKQATHENENLVKKLGR